MPIHQQLLLLLLLLPEIFITATTTTTDSDFIRSSCMKTTYPDLCYTSLSIYSNVIKQNPAALARVSIAVSLFRTLRMARHATNLSRSADYESDHRLSAAIHDCVSVYGDAVDQIRDSLRKMKKIVMMNRELGDATLRLELNDVQTWMSAALTNEDTCIDGFEDVEDGEMKLDVCYRTIKVKEVTSNALALVNSYADKVLPVPPFP
ncbi:21 kDa protein-like [Impatiens glandulifera]|uniref:21 kDa protein-like n=1 Tax=Impatiens glandulifera TaxID=253017 RepID=UPI001FB0E7D4|nr:21 kDa protein-like [Impatiens glandulifera]